RIPEGPGAALPAAARPPPFWAAGRVSRHRSAGGRRGPIVSGTGSGAAPAHHGEGVPMQSGSTTSWRELGRCKGEDPELFYPEDDEDLGVNAKAICAMCLVSETCLESALRTRANLR